MGEKGGSGSWRLRRRQDQGSFHSPVQIHGREFSVWAFFVCGKDLLGYTGGRSEDCAGDLVEHLLQRLILNEADLPQ